MKIFGQVSVFALLARDLSRVAGIKMILPGVPLHYGSARRDAESL